MSAFLFILVGFFIGVLLYDVLGDRKVIISINNAFNDVRKGFKEARSNYEKNRPKTPKGGVI